MPLTHLLDTSVYSQRVTTPRTAKPSAQEQRAVSICSRSYDWHSRNSPAEPKTTPPVIWSLTKAAERRQVGLRPDRTRYGHLGMEYILDYGSFAETVQAEELRLNASTFESPLRPYASGTLPANRARRCGSGWPCSGPGIGRTVPISGGPYARPCATHTTRPPRRCISARSPTAWDRSYATHRTSAGREY